MKVEIMVASALVALSLNAEVCNSHFVLPDSPVDQLSFEVVEYGIAGGAERKLGHFTYGSGTNGVFLGGVGKYGSSYGIKPKDAFPVSSGDICTIAFEGMVTNVDSTYLFYIDAYDAKGAVVNAKCPAPKDWSYSIYSKRYAMMAVALDRVGGWTSKKLNFQVPDGVAAIRVILCPWRGTGVWCRSLTVSTRSGPRGHKVVFSSRKTEGDGTTALFSEKDELALRVKAQKNAFGIYDIAATISDEAKPPRARAIKLHLAAGKPLAGWRWHDTWRTSKEICNNDVLRCDEEVGGHPVSHYPFTAVSKGSGGFMLATPIDEPIYESRAVTTNGIVSTVAVGLLPRPAGGTSATYRWQLLSYAGDWGFRSAAKAYYDAQGGVFPEPKANAKEGTWLWPIAPSKAPDHPEDFGLTFWEAWSSVARHPKEITAAHERGIEVYPYTEAWGMRQQLPTLPDGGHPSESVSLAELLDWVATDTPKRLWFDVPRNVAALALINSLPILPEGGFPHLDEKWDDWVRWWRTNPDPRLPKPCRASISWEGVIAPALSNDVDGVYLDSVCYGYPSKFCNVRADHLAVISEPLLYDTETAKPCSDGMQHQVAFVSWLSKRLHDRNKRLFGNVFGIAHRFHATTIDIFGSEVGRFGVRPGCDTLFRTDASDREACEKRFFARHRPITDLLQEGCHNHPVVAVSAAGITNYVNRQIFYGFYPGVSTIGGEEKAGYANWLRYFGPKRQCERDRQLFKIAVPLIRQLNQARWQPETLVRSSDDCVWIERFGQLPGDCFITVRNASDKAKDVTLRFDFAFSSIEPVWIGSPLPQHAKGGERLTISPWNTAVYRLK